jgi:hypothetical protein
MANGVDQLEIVGSFLLKMHYCQVFSFLFSISDPEMFRISLNTLTCDRKIDEKSIFWRQKTRIGVNVSINSYIIDGIWARIQPSMCPKRREREKK